jgi:hypothetical protein
LNHTQHDLRRPPESYFETGVDLGWTKFKKYYTLTDVSPIYRAAVLLHPAHKWEDFEEKWAEHPRWIKGAQMVDKELSDFCKGWKNSCVD